MHAALSTPRQLFLQFLLWACFPIIEHCGASRRTTENEILDPPKSPTPTLVTAAFAMCLHHSSTQPVHPGMDMNNCMALGPVSSRKSDGQQRQVEIKQLSQQQHHLGLVGTGLHLEHSKTGQPCFCPDSEDRPSHCWLLYVEVAASKQQGFVTSLLSWFYASAVLNSRAVPCGSSKPSLCVTLMKV